MCREMGRARHSQKPEPNVCSPSDGNHAIFIGVLPQVTRYLASLVVAIGPVPVWHALPEMELPLPALRVPKSITKLQRSAGLYDLAKRCFQLSSVVF